MGESIVLDSTKPTCWGYNPEPDSHDAFVGWRTIYSEVNGKPRLEYVPLRGSAKGLQTDCERLVRWWGERVKWWKRDVPETWWLRTCAPYRQSKRGPHVICGLTKFGYMAAVVKSSGDYVYISLYLNKIRGKAKKAEPEKTKCYVVCENVYRNETLSSVNIIGVGKTREDGARIVEENRRELVRLMGKGDVDTIDASGAHEFRQGNGYLFRTCIVESEMLGKGKRTGGDNA